MEENKLDKIQVQLIEVAQHGWIAKQEVKRWHIMSKFDLL